MLACASETMRLMSASTPGTLRCTLRMRWRSRSGGGSTCGKFTAPVVAPVLTNLTSALATSRPIASCASSVEPPTCGVRITLGSAAELGREGVGVAVGLRREDVDRRARQVAGAERRRERLDLDDAAAADVEEVGAGLHAAKLALADQPSGVRRLRARAG